MAKTKNICQVIQIKSKSRPHLLFIFIQNYHNILLYLGFFVYKGAQC